MDMDTILTYFMKTTDDLRKENANLNRENGKLIEQVKQLENMLEVVQSLAKGHFRIDEDDRDDDDDIELDLDTDKMVG